MRIEHNITDGVYGATVEMSCAEYQTFEMRKDFPPNMRPGDRWFRREGNRLWLCECGLPLGRPIGHPGIGRTAPREEPAFRVLFAQVVKITGVRADVARRA